MLKLLFLSKAGVHDKKQINLAMKANAIGYACVLKFMDQNGISTRKMTLYDHELIYHMVPAFVEFGAEDILANSTQQCESICGKFKDVCRNKTNMQDSSVAFPLIESLHFTFQRSLCFPDHMNDSQNADLGSSVSREELKLHEVFIPRELITFDKDDANQDGKSGFELFEESGLVDTDDDGAV